MISILIALILLPSFLDLGICWAQLAMFGLLLLLKKL